MAKTFSRCRDSVDVADFSRGAEYADSHHGLQRRGIQNVIDSLPTPKAKGARGEDFTDSSLMEEIRKSGFFEKLSVKGS